MTACHLVIHGRVQGVCYRDWTAAAAREFGVAGWVRNCDDGTVVARLEGDEDAVRRMVERMREGPPAARVERVEATECPEEGLKGFARR